MDGTAEAVTVVAVGAVVGNRVVVVGSVAAEYGVCTLAAAYGAYRGW